MELNWSGKRTELFGWVDGLGADEDEDHQGFSDSSLSLYESMCLTVSKPKMSLEDRLIDDYVSGSIRTRFQKARLIMVLVGERIFDCLDESEIFKLMEVDDFIGGKAMSYKLFGKPRSAQQIQSLNKNSFLTDVSTSQARPDPQIRTIMPKTEQAMLRIRKTNLILNRPDSRKASIVSTKDTPGLSAGFSTSSVSQLTRPDTAESLTSSRPRLAPIAAPRGLNPKPQTQAPPAPQPYGSTGSLASRPTPKPQTPTGAKLFALPFGAAQQLQKHPEQQDTHLLRFAEAIQRRVCRGWTACVAGQTTVTAAVCECSAGVAEVLSEVQTVRAWADSRGAEGLKLAESHRHSHRENGVAVGGGGVGRSRFWDAVGQAAQIGRWLEGVEIGKELERLEARTIRGTGVKEVVFSIRFGVWGFTPNFRLWFNGAKTY